MTLINVDKNSTDPDYWQLISSNRYLSIDFIVDNIHLPWNWRYISSNPNITKEDVEYYPELPWDWKGLSFNESVDINFLIKHKDKPWDWDQIIRFSHEFTIHEFLNGPFPIRLYNFIEEIGVLQCMSLFPNISISKYVIYNDEIEEFIQCKDCCCCMKGSRYRHSSFHGYYDIYLIEKHCRYHLMIYDLNNYEGRTYDYNVEDVKRYQAFVEKTANMIIEYYKEILIKKSRERTAIIKEELMAKCWSPERLQYYLEKYNYDINE